MTDLVKDDLKKGDGQDISTKQYFFVFEGELTEPGYFKYLKENRRELGIKPLIKDDSIKRNVYIDKGNTDILPMIAIGDSYINSSLGNGYTPWELCTRLLEICYMTIKRRIVGKNSGKKIPKGHYTEKQILEKMRTFRNELIKQIERGYGMDDKPHGIKLNNGVIENLNIAIDYLAEKINVEFNTTIDKTRLPLNIDFSKRDVKVNDVLCIVHDRDYSKYFFPNDVYLNAVKWINNHNNNHPKVIYKLGITYPKFEFWLLMHAMNKQELSKLDMDYLTNYEGEKVYPLEDQKTGPSQYVTDIARIFIDENIGKKITKNMFKNIYKDKINKAIDNSLSDDFTHDVTQLMSKPGSSLGVIFKEMME